VSSKPAQPKPSLLQTYLSHRETQKIKKFVAGIKTLHGRRYQVPDSYRNLI
jgi:hypothetical protein